MSDQLVLISVGNTRTRFAPVRDGQLEPSRVETNADVDALAKAVLAAAAEESEDDASPVLIASVNRPVSDRLIKSLRAVGRRALRLEPAATGEGVLPIPIAHSLADADSVGPDRLLDALGAFSRAAQACVVIDAGTAITVDFVDGDGTFHGGAIAPGLRMMLDAMHEKTAALPQIPTPLTPDLLPPTDPKQPPFGRSTRPAMVLGALSAARGMAHLLIDRYAEFYEAYPRIIATGGDAALLFENDELVEHIVPDLTLVGMLEAYRRLEHLDQEGAESSHPHQ
jgi:type III pantothenate kinase